MRDLRIQLFLNHPQLGKQAQRLLCRFLVQLGNGKTDVHDGVVADLDFWYVGQAHIFDDTGKINPAHADLVRLIDFDYTPWDA